MEDTPQPRASPIVTLGWLVLALAIAAGGTLWSRLRTPPPPAGPSWRRPVSELSPAQQQLHARLRASVRAAEAVRSQSGQWPPGLGTLQGGWTQRRQGLTVNYLGEGEGLRWLVLFLEPDPRLAAEPAPPEDDEHHTLSDGTALHVTVWTQPLSEPKPGQVVAFPAAEGWVERVAR